METTSARWFQEKLCFLRVFIFLFHKRPCALWVRDGMKIDKVTWHLAMQEIKVAQVPHQSSVIDPFHIVAVVGQM